MNIITESLTLELAKNRDEVYSFDVCGVNFINLDKFYRDAFFITNQTAYEYNIEFNFKNKDIKKIFYNAFIFSLCEFLKSKKHKHIFYFNKTDKEKHYVFIVKKCESLLPLYVYTHKVSFNKITEMYEEGSEEVCSDLEKLIRRAVQFENYNFTFKRLNNFLKNNELLFLRNAYFTQHQIKLALMT
jgi:hypothetical protein